MSAFEDFVNLELPRRPAMLNLEITTYDGDPNGGTAPAILNMAPKGTFFLQNTGEVLWYKRTSAPGSWIQVGSGGGGTDTIANVGTAEPGAAGVFAVKVGNEFQLKSLVPGTGVTLTPNADHILIDATGAGGGEVNTASNLGTTPTREGTFFAKVGADLRFKSLVPGTNVTLVADDDEIIINASGGIPAVVGHLSIANVVPNGSGVVSVVWEDAPTNSIVTSCTSSTSQVIVSIRSSYPKVIVEGVSATLPLVGGVYFGTVAITLTGATITAEIDKLNGDVTTCAVTLEAPPEITSLSFTGAYPGVQTELKAGDTVQITVTADSDFVGLEVMDFGAGISQVIGPFAPTSGPSIHTITIANRGTNAQLLPARIRVRNAAGAYGATRDTNAGGGTTELVDLVNLNNRYPDLAWEGATYPLGQGALKNAESADVEISINDTDTVVFSSPNGQLSILDPTVIEATKTVTRIAGSYNVSVNNLRVTGTRTANNATAFAECIVNIANVAATISVTEPAARLRSGGNNGTAPQNHTITITSNQQLLSPPTLSAGAGGGTLQGAGWVGGPTVFTRTLQVHDNDVKGTYNWNGLSATNLAGIVTATILGDTSYVLGGFVPRSFTFPPYTNEVSMGVAVVTYNRLQATLFTATNAVPVRMAVMGDTGNLANGFTVLTTGTNPTTLHWNDNDASQFSNSGGTAQIIGIEETV